MDADGIQQLLRPAAFDHPAGDIVLRETHISWVILCGQFAYKIKKPVDFGFLDYSTLSRRRWFCEEELRLNRRFSAEIYLAVVAVTADRDGPRINGAGAVLDYAVQMRRFDEAQLLASIAARGQLDPGLLRALGRELARLHATLPPVHPEPGGAGPGSPAALRSALEQNFEQIRRYPLRPAELAQLEAVADWQRQSYHTGLSLLRQRAADGLVIDGHGDAHLGNIALVDGSVTLFDCIEFSALFRVEDSVSEIALLTMDLEARGHPGESHILLNDYLEYRGDYQGLALLDLYRSYYAMVRAKVSLLREPPARAGITDTGAYGEMCRYLALAHSCCQPRQRFLAITHGVSGSGKSTAAGQLSAAAGAVRIRSDVERKRLFGLAPEQRCRAGETAALYSPEMTRKTFIRLERLAADILGAGLPVIIDATFLHRAVRSRFRELAGEVQVPFAILHCAAPEKELRARLSRREQQAGDASDAGVIVMQRQLSEREPLDERESALTLELTPDATTAGLWQRFRRRFLS